MKKIGTVLLITILILLVSALTVFAGGQRHFKGLVLSNDLVNVVVIETNKGEIYTITTPDDFDLTTLELGDYVLVSGEPNDVGEITAIKMLRAGKPADKGKPEGAGQGKPDDAGEGKPDFPNEGKFNHSAFCDSDKEMDNLNALISGIAKKYTISQGELIEHFCNGYSLGAIMIALKTSDLGGGDYVSILESRADGMNWGAIWKENNLIGNEADGKTPPGWLQRSDKANKP